VVFCIPEINTNPSRPLIRGSPPPDKEGGVGGGFERGEEFNQARAKRSFARAGIVLYKSYMEKENNLAFIDGQNLYMNTAKKEANPWKIDLARFRIYLEKKYNVKKAYYFLGYVQEKNQELYEEIQNAGFVLIFREHNPSMLGKKKGNVDSDIIFYVMKKLYKKEDFEYIILVSGDGDYKLLVDFLVEEKSSGKYYFQTESIDLLYIKNYQIIISLI